MSRMLTALLLVALLVGTTGCGEGDDGTSGTPPTTQSGGDAAFGKTTPPADDDFDEQEWELQDGGGPTPTTPLPTPTTPTTPTSPPTGGNRPPLVSAITLDPSGSTVAKGGTVHITVTASDPDADPLEYAWGATGGTFDTTEGFRAVWRTPDMTGAFEVTVTVTDGKGGTISARQNFTVVANNNPVIRSLSTSASAVGPGGSVIVSGAADDPDGDPVSYKWTADGGVITGTGQNVTWVAPQVSPGGQAQYTIQLTAEDGKGGISIKTATVSILFGYVTEVFNAIPAATGTVVLNGGSDTTVLRAGDNSANASFRAFWSFDLGKLKSTDIQHASLQFSYKQTTGDPFNLSLGIGGIRVWRVRYSPEMLPSYNLESISELTVEPLRESPTEYDITVIVEPIGANMSFDDLVQIMVGFQKVTNNDGKEDSMEWNGATLTVTYAPA